MESEDAEKKVADSVSVVSLLTTSSAAPEAPLSSRKRQNTSTIDVTPDNNTPPNKYDARVDEQARMWLLQQQLAEETTQKFDHLRRATTLQAKFDETTTQLRLSEEARFKAETDLVKKTGECDLLNSQLATVRANNDFNQERIRKLETEKDELSRKLDAQYEFTTQHFTNADTRSQETIRELQKQVELFQTRLIRRSDYVNAVRFALTDSDTTISVSGSDVGDDLKDEDINAVINSVRSKTRQWLQDNQTVIQLQTELQMVKLSVGQKEEARQRAESETQAARDSLSEINRQLVVSQETNKRLSDQSVTENRTLDELQQQLASCRLQITATKTEEHGLVDSVKTLFEDLAKTHRESMETFVEDKTREINLTTDLCNLRAQHDKTEKELADLQVEYNRTESAYKKEKEEFDRKTESLRLATELATTNATELLSSTNQIKAAVALFTNLTNLSNGNAVDDVDEDEWNAHFLSLYKPTRDFITKCHSDEKKERAPVTSSRIPMSTDDTHIDFNDVDMAHDDPGDADSKFTERASAIAPAGDEEKKDAVRAVNLYRRCVLAFSAQVIKYVTQLHNNGDASTLGSMYQTGQLFHDLLEMRLTENPTELQDLKEPPSYTVEVMHCMDFLWLFNELLVQQARLCHVLRKCDNVQAYDKYRFAFTDDEVNPRRRDDSKETNAISKAVHTVDGDVFLGSNGMFGTTYKHIVAYDYWADGTSDGAGDTRKMQVLRMAYLSHARLRQLRITAERVRSCVNGLRHLRIGEDMVGEDRERKISHDDFVAYVSGQARIKEMLPPLLDLVSKCASDADDPKLFDRLSRGGMDYVALDDALGLARQMKADNYILKERDKLEKERALLFYLFTSFYYFTSSIPLVYSHATMMTGLLERFVSISAENARRLNEANSWIEEVKFSPDSERIVVAGVEKLKALISDEDANRQREKEQLFQLQADVRVIRSMLDTRKELFESFSHLFKEGVARDRFPITEYGLYETKVYGGLVDLFDKTEAKLQKLTVELNIAKRKADEEKETMERWAKYLFGTVAQFVDRFDLNESDQRFEEMDRELSSISGMIHELDLKNNAHDDRKQAEEDAKNMIEVIANVRHWFPLAIMSPVIKTLNSVVEHRNNPFEAHQAKKLQLDSLYNVQRKLTGIETNYILLSNQLKQIQTISVQEAKELEELKKTREALTLAKVNFALYKNVIGLALSVTKQKTPSTGEFDKQSVVDDDFITSKPFKIIRTFFQLVAGAVPTTIQAMIVPDFFQVDEDGRMQLGRAIEKLGRDSAKIENMEEFLNSLQSDHQRLEKAKKESESVSAESKGSEDSEDEISDANTNEFIPLAMLRKLDKQQTKDKHADFMMSLSSILTPMAYRSLTTSIQLLMSHPMFRTPWLYKIISDTVTCNAFATLVASEYNFTDLKRASRNYTSSQQQEIVNGQQAAIFYLTRMCEWDEKKKCYKTKQLQNQNRYIEL